MLYFDDGANGGEDMSQLSQRVSNEGSFLSADGLKLFCQTWPSQRGEVRATLIVLHGLKDHSGRYAELAARLATRGFNVSAFDLRGHGRSEGRRVYIRDFSQYVNDLDRFLAQVRRDAPERPVFLFGHSLGGTICTRLVMTGERGISGLILSAAASRPGARVNPLLISLVKLLGVVLPGFPIMNLPDRLFSRDAKVVQEMAVDPAIYHKKGPAHTAAQFLGAMQQIQKAPAKVTTPLLILHGTADKLTNPEGSRRLQDKAGSTDKTLKLYAGLYHDLVHEPEKELVISDIQTWLEGHAAPLR
jgi:acylglycerol lipase